MLYIVLFINITCQYNVVHSIFIVVLITILASLLFGFFLTFGGNQFLRSTIYNGVQS